MIETNSLQRLKELRQEIHRNPELSGEEIETAKKIKSFIKQFNPDKLVENIGGSGLIFQFKGKEAGPNVTIRAELDALPIQEINTFSHRSGKDHIGHLCGHDGHMVMVAGLAESLSNQRPNRGNVNLLFQPAEETGQGAYDMLEDDKFSEIQHDFMFALHNLPGFDKNEIIIKEEVFASASKGLIIELFGRTSHAAEPEKGNSPSQAVAEILQKIKKLPETLKNLKDFCLVTIVHVRIGERAFGTTPGEAVIMATLRAYRDEDLQSLDEAARLMSKTVCEEYDLEYLISETERFSSTVNDKECVALIEESAAELGLGKQRREEPFRWSEDFGLFTKNYKGAMFGLGSGVHTPALHNPDYDFPDEIMKSGMSMFLTLIRKLTD